MPTVASATALDYENNDLYLDENNQVAMITDTSALVSQAIACRVKTVQGEWYQSPDVGVPYFSDVFVKNPDLTTLQHLFTTIVSGVPGVKSVDRMDLTLDSATRRLFIEFTVTATDDTVVTGSI